MRPIEKLGAFYLGKSYDLSEGKRLETPVMYDARDLTTHAACIGMTGSGKTGLCIDLLEEAALDGVPAIIIDPKGDMGNLLLTFPELRPADFKPWVNVDDARRKGMNVDEYAGHIAKTWRKGLAEWDQDPDRIRRLKESAEFRVYTPGSDAGIPVSILSSFRAPALSWQDHGEAIREQIKGTVNALLGLAGIEADPLKSREHILLSTIFEHSWREGKDLDMAGLITSVQTPPVRTLGVFDIETFFPGKDRFGLAMALNNIIAAPGFASWIKGEPLDISSLLHNPGGLPRHSIFSVAHLNDAERMFFVTLLLEQIKTWMRRQSGTTSLRALLYFDEVYGFLPPVANPPSKEPLMTLLKQARAFGLGVMLTTQNPVDLDYKGLSNTGTWFIGKLQTERDKKRVLDGLESVTSESGGTVDRSRLDEVISSLGSRVFLLHNVHEQHPVIFQTRWAMSYLRGPLTREQVRQLMAASTTADSADVRGADAAGTAAGDKRTGGVRTVTGAGRPAAEARAAETGATDSGMADDETRIDESSPYSNTPPALPPDLTQVHLPLELNERDAFELVEQELGRRLEDPQSTLLYNPCLVALGRVRFVDRKLKIESERRVGLLLTPDSLASMSAWEQARRLNPDQTDLEDRPEPDALFGPLPERLNSVKEIKALTKEFSDVLYHEQRLELHHNPSLKLYGEPGETEADFRVRARHLAREKRDDDVQKLRNRYRAKLDRLETRLVREERELSEDKAEYAARKREELLSAGETLISVLGMFGGRRSKRGLSTAARKRRMTSRAKAEIAESEEEITRLHGQIEDMRREMEAQAEEIANTWTEKTDDLTTRSVRPRRSDVRIDHVGLAWAPSWEIAHRSALGSDTHTVLEAWREERVGESPA